MPRDGDSAAAVSGAPARSLDWDQKQPFSAKLLQERLRILQIGGFEPFGEPAVDWRKQVVGVAPLAPVGPKPGEIARGAKLEDTRRLPPGGGERGVEGRLRDPSVAGVESQAGAGAHSAWRACTS